MVDRLTDLQRLPSSLTATTHSKSRSVYSWEDHFSTLLTLLVRFFVRDWQ